MSFIDRVLRRANPFGRRGLSVPLRMIPLARLPKRLPDGVVGVLYCYRSASALRKAHGSKVSVMKVQEAGDGRKD
jgi:hypothetical protein